VNKSAILLALLATTAQAAVQRGMPIEALLESLRADGIELFYSSDLIKPWMRVGRESRAVEPQVLLAEVLAPYGITVARGPQGTLMLVRDTVRAPRHTLPGAERSPAPAPIDAVIVSASHYRFGDEPTFAPTALSAAQLELMPDLGDDPLRALARLPGVASQDFSSRVNVRGGTVQETLFRFDDLRLYNPYHLKDFFGVFSSIDPAIVSDIRVYTGGFPVVFGDRSSGVVDIAPRLPAGDFHGQVVLSAMTAGAMLDGGFADGAGDWAVAARRGNLDLFLDAVDSPLGEPEYYDGYAHAGRRVNEWLAVSANLLQFHDRVLAFDSDAEEEARAEYDDRYYWVRLDLGEPDGLGGRVLAGQTRIESERVGTADLSGVGSGELRDERSFTINSIQADGWWRVGTHSLLQAGAEWSEQSGRYDYEDEAEFAVLFLTSGAPTEPERFRSVHLSPEGHQGGAYANWRFEPSAAVATDLGIRWDRSTLTAQSSSQWSPRAVLMWRPDERTRVRVGWGRYHQAQGISELQASDGESRFQPTQRATHHVASVERELSPAWMLRAELYRKDYQRPFARHENLLNTVVVLPELKPDRILIAPDEARAEGAELSLNYASGPLSGWLSFTHARVRDRIDGDWINRSWDLRENLGAGLSWRGADWEASLATIWHRGWPTTGVELAALEPFPLVAVGKPNATQLEDYFRVDLRIARRFDLESAGVITVFAEASNLMKRNNDCCVEYQLEEEIDGVPIEVPLLDVEVRGSLPLIPSVGVIWNF
jgi:outer membrane receptor protein involved in Fe transport